MLGSKELPNFSNLAEEASPAVVNITSSRTVKERNTYGRGFGDPRYDEFFEGLDYEMNRKGLALHVNMTRWLDEGIRKTLEKEFSLP